jgi:hypothetical protein
MLREFVSSLALVTLLTPAVQASSIDISFHDTDVPANGTFQINRLPEHYVFSEVSVRKRHRIEVGSDIQFNLVDKPSLTFSIEDHFSFFRDTDLTKFPELHFAPAFLKSTLREGRVVSMSSEDLRKAILRTPLNQLFDEPSRTALYDFILERANLHLVGRTITMDEIRKRLPEDLAFKYFLFPPHRLIYNALDPVQTPEDLQALLTPPKKVGVIAYSINAEEGLVTTKVHEWD